jgi:outer membrane protein OmpA-like peptidoglycan-associated protein
MEPVWSPGDPGGPQQPSAARAQAPSSNLVWGPPPADIAIAQAPFDVMPAAGGSAGFGFDAPRSPQLATSIRFTSGSSRVGSGDERELRRVADQYRRSGGTVTVIGYSSLPALGAGTVQTQLQNFSISLDRANAVAGALQRLGVPSERIEIAAQPQPAGFSADPSVASRADVFVR